MRDPNKLGEERIGSLLWQFSIPAITGMIVFALYNIVSRVFISRVEGDLALAGISLTFPIFTILIAVGMLIGVGSANLISIRLGEHKKDEAEKILGNAFSLFVLTGIVLTALSLFYAEDLLILFGASSQTLPYAMAYCIPILWSIIISFMAMGMNNIIRAEGNPAIAMNTMLIGAFLSLLLNPLFIYKFHWGVQGAAYATVISNVISAIWVLAHFTVGKSYLRLRWQNLKIDLKIMFPALAIGLSPFVMQLAASLVAVIANLSLAHFGGDIAIGAMGIVNSIAILTIMPITGLSQASQPILGFNYGAKKFQRLKDTLNLSIIAATVFSTFGFILVVFFPHLIINLFVRKSDTLMMQTTVQGLQIFLFMLPLIGFQLMGANYFQAVSKPKVSIFLNLLRQMILFIPLVFFLPHVFGLAGVWLAGPVSDTIAALITAVVLYLEIRSLNRKILQEA
ncbi:MAG: MATE family efflux transporter [Candidatus Margulisiibacteriota bacterium]|jgi:putative MATE family efflux protein